METRLPVVRLPLTLIRVDRLLGLVFFLSGLSSLIYQVVWQRVLTLHYGVGPVSITIIVSVYMFGLGAGALIGGRISERVRSRIKMYMLLELLLGGFGCISLPFIGWIGSITAGSSHLLSLVYMFALLSFPTLLMGMTLPVLVKAFSEFNDDFLGNLSRLYFLNTFGAAVGALSASYLLISFGGLDVATFTAAAINLALVVLVAPVRTVMAKVNTAAPGPSNGLRGEDLLGWVAYPAVFLSGFLAIGYEIVWLRVIAVLTKASAYAFSTSLAVYLFGIALGSYFLGNLLRRNSPDKQSLFFLLQFSISVFAGASFICYYRLSQVDGFSVITSASFNNILHPRLDISHYLEASDYLGALLAVTDVFLWPILFVFGPTLLMGASFPLISHLAQSRQSKEGRTVGQVYFFNTIGNVLGGLVTGFVLLSYLGTEQTLLVFTAIGSTFILFTKSFQGRPVSQSFRIAILVLVLTVSIALFPARTELYRAMHPSEDVIETRIDEGTAGVVVTGRTERRIFTYINGLGHGGRPNYRFYIEALEAASLTRNIRTALVIGYGTGSIVEALLKLDELQSLRLVEINPVLIDNLRKFPGFPDLLADPRIQLVLDDARRYLLRSEDKFDLIIMDPLRTTTSYSNNIYSKEFFESVANRLTTGGALSVWTDEYRVIPKTLGMVFSHLRMFGYFVVSSNAPMSKNQSRYEKHLNQFSDVARRGIRRRTRQHLGDRAYVMKVAGLFPINTDLNPVCEYYIGLQIKRTFLWLKDTAGDEPGEWPSPD